jgi:hypothetical protein
MSAREDPLVECRDLSFHEDLADIPYSLYFSVETATSLLAVEE